MQNNNLGESQKNYWVKKANPRRLYETINKTFLKWQSYRNGKQLSGSWKLSRGSVVGESGHD